MPYNLEPVVAAVRVANYYIVITLLHCRMEILLSIHTFQTDTFLTQKLCNYNYAHNVVVKLCNYCIVTCLHE